MMFMRTDGRVVPVWDIKPKDTNQAVNWVELKTSAEILNERDQVKFERKLLKFWIQSFLFGVAKIIVGFRNQDGILQRLEELETQNIPERVKNQGHNLWDGNICINFASEFLGWLKTIIKGEGVWRIRKQEKLSSIEVYRIEEAGHGEILSQSFVQWRSHGIQEATRKSPVTASAISVTTSLQGAPNGNKPSR